MYTKPAFTHPPYSKPPAPGPRPSPGNKSCRNQQFLQRLAQLRWAWGDGNSSSLHRRDLAFGIALAARDDRPGVTHAAAGRRGPAGDEPNHGLAATASRLVGEELRGI